MTLSDILRDAVQDECSVNCNGVMVGEIDTENECILQKGKLLIWSEDYIFEGFWGSNQI